MRRGRSHGQALVEAAIALPLLALLMSGMLDLGRAWHTQTSINDAARNAARVVAGNYAGHGPDDTTVCNELQNDLARFGTVTCTFATSPPPYSYPSLGPGQLQAVVYPPYSTPSCDATSPCRGVVQDPLHTEVYVFIYYRYQLLTPLISQLVGSNGLSSQAEADMRSSW